jgi:hypothetical protein
MLRHQYKRTIVLHRVDYFPREFAAPPQLGALWLPEDNIEARDPQIAPPTLDGFAVTTPLFSPITLQQMMPLRRALLQRAALRTCLETRPLLNRITATDGHNLRAACRALRAACRLPRLRSHTTATAPAEAPGDLPAAPRAAAQAAQSTLLEDAVDLLELARLALAGARPVLPA